MIDRMIRKKLDSIGFVELKKDENLNGIKIKKSLPLPIMVSDLKEKIGSENIESIDLKIITKAMLFVLGCDENFLYKIDYKEILTKSLKDIRLAVILLVQEESNALDRYIYLKSLSALSLEDGKSIYLKAQSLEDVFNENLEKLKEKEQTEILTMLVNLYESIRDEKIIPYAEYRLAIINEATGNYLKSKLYLDKALNDSDPYDDTLKESIRNKLEVVSDYAKIETAETYINYSEFEKARENLNGVSIYYNDQSYLHYLKGHVENATGNTEKAVNEFKIALSLNKKDEDYYNSLAISLLNLGKTKEAIKVLEDGSDTIENSFNIKYNLGLLYNKIGMTLDSIEYLKEAYALDPREELLEFIKKIEKTLE